jgi:bacteriocin-like protein
MSNDNNRALNRMGARKLTENEMEEISGGKFTFATALLTGSVDNPDATPDQ